MGRGVLGEIVDDHQRMPAAIAIIFADREARERRDPLQRGRGGGRSDHEHTALGRAELAHRLDDPLDRRRPLADRDIDANDVRPLLADDGIDRDRRLAGGAIADDELALSAAQRKQRIDHQHAGLDRLGHQRALNDRRRRAARSGETPRPRSVGRDQAAGRADRRRGRATRFRPGTRAASPVALTCDPTTIASASSRIAVLIASGSSDKT